MARKPVNQSRSSMRPFYLGLAAIAVVGVAFVLWQLASGGGGTAATEPVPVVVSNEELSRVQGISVGREDAPVVIYEFADFQCPGCGDFATFTAPLVKERLVDTGRVRFVYYDFPLPQHQNAFLAARAARCANDQDRFWDYHDILYGRQARWSLMANPTDFFEDLAEELGLDGDAFGACLRSDRYQEEVTRSLQLGQMLGVRSTPTLFVNMKRIEQQTIPTFADVQRYVEAEMAAPAPGGVADTAASGTAPADTAAPATP